MFGKRDFMRKSKNDAYKLNDHGMKPDQNFVSKESSENGQKSMIGSKGASRLASNKDSQKQSSRKKTEATSPKKIQKTPKI